MSGPAEALRIAYDVWSVPTYSFQIILRPPDYVAAEKAASALIFPSAERNEQ
jgi:hypothetical protein